MVTYQHKIWLKNLRGLFAKIGVERVKSFFIFIIFFLIVFISVNRIISSVNSGLQTQKKFDKVSMDVAELEKQNRLLQYNDELFKSNEAQEIKIRTLEDKKKQDEILYAVGKEETASGLAPLPDLNQNSAPKEQELSNWEKWITKIF